MKKCCFFLAPVMLLLTSCSKTDIQGNNKPAEYTINWNSAADSSSSTLVLSFWNARDKYFNDNNAGLENFNYWPQAHALDILIDAYVRTNDHLYRTTIDQWYEGVKTKNGNTFYNVYYDDMEWIALSMLRAFDNTQDIKFKLASVELWKDIQTGWNMNAGGGIAWKKDQLYSKNACSNGPAAILAARIFQRFGDLKDKEWALKIYDWEKQHLFNPSSGAVADNIDSRTGVVNDSWIFTYNQGTFMGAALELYKITGERGYLNDAIKAADYTLNNLVNGNDRLIKNEGTGDGGLFKGIFVRYFIQLILNPDLDAATKRRYTSFIEYNSECLWRLGTNKQLVLFGPYWKTKPASVTGLAEQISGSVLIEAMALLNK